MADEPVQDEYRIMANQKSLLLGLVATGFFSMAFLQAGGRWKWVALFLACCCFSCLYNILWPVPMIRATREGLYLGIGKFGRRYCCVPWERVDGVVETKVYPPAGPDNYYLIDALGFVIRQDEFFKLPRFQWNASGQGEDLPKDAITFSRDMIDGDVKTWAQKLEAFRKSVRHLPA
jgi:hypothetical protein